MDCIDCAAEASVVSAVNEGIEAAIEISSLPRPWVMISVNDDEDLHFRKAGNSLNSFFILVFFFFFFFFLGCGISFIRYVVNKKKKIFYI